MADLARIKRNVRKMADQGAPEQDIDGYIASEGVTVDDVRNFRDQSAALAPNEIGVKLPERPAATSPYEFDLGALSAATGGAQSGAFMGWDDEIGAAMTAPINAGIDWVKGKGFDVGKHYDEIYERNAGVKTGRRAEHPIASAVGEVAGGLAVGGNLAQNGVTLTGRAIPHVGKMLPAAVEGAAYGAVTGAGEEQPGDRLEGAGWGALVGGATGAATERIGRAFSNSAARRATPPAPGLDELQRETDALYQASRAAGVGIKSPAVDKMVANVQMAAGQLNPKLRPNTAGVVDDALALRGRNITLEELDEFRQQIGLAMKNADPQDVRTLMRVKTVVDGLDGTLLPKDVTGNAVQGFDFLKQGRMLNARKEKTALIERMLDFADVDTGKYTQSGLANTIRQRSAALYRQIAKGQVKGFTQEETALVRQMAKGGSASKMINWLAKLNPKGAVSIMANMAGASGGAALLGPAGAAVGIPLAAGGYMAGRAADKGALAAANALRDAAARGFVYRPQLPPNAAGPFIGGATQATTGLTRR